jgi:hypothetical protein
MLWLTFALDMAHCCHLTILMLRECHQSPQYNPKNNKYILLSTIIEYNVQQKLKIKKKINMYNTLIFCPM